METESIPSGEGETREKEFVRQVYDSSAARASVHIEVGKTNKNPFESPENHEQALILDGFRRQGENVIFVNPNHGNEPYILGVSTALSINRLLRENGHPEAEIIVPLLYPGRQERILRENFGGEVGRIHLDPEAGEIMKETMFGSDQYGEHLKRLNELNAKIHERVRDHLSRNIRTTSLSSGDTREFDGRNVVLDINTGSRFPATENSYFAFPTLLSELLEETLKTDLPFDRQLLLSVQRQAQDFEAGYRKTFIPDIHTFSYKADTYDVSGKELTPPMKHPGKPPHDIDKEGVYVMLSGTGSRVDEVMKSSQDLGLEVYYSPFITMNTGTAALPDIIYHPNIRAVFGRMGWGTGWLCQLAGKPFIAVPHNPSDDPEIFFNLKTLEAERLGVVYEGQSEIVRKALELTGDIEKLNRKIRGKYGTLDGIDYMAGKIVEDLHQKRAREFPTV